MTDTYNENDLKSTQDKQQASNAETSNNTGENYDTIKTIMVDLPTNRVIRKRLAARTIGVHSSALPPELQALVDPSRTPYLMRKNLPEEIQLTVSNEKEGENSKLFSRDEAWEFADEAGSKLEWKILPDTMGGKATALFSTTGQGVYANYGRPTMDFSGFFHDYIHIHRKSSGSSIAPKSLGSVLLGPIFITLDTISAAGFTAIGHTTRGAPLTDKTVLTDVVSTGVYEGTTSWASARLGVLTGAKVMRLAATLPIPGIHLAAVPLGFLAGATTAIFFKRFSNQTKDQVIDATYDSAIKSKADDTNLETVPVPA